VVRLCPFCLLPLRECLGCDDAEQPPTWASPPYECQVCRDTGHVCKTHPSRPWGLLCCEGPVLKERGRETLCEHGACHCRAGGELCGCGQAAPREGARM
jgi:hypothetical protein